ncbi:MAG: SagB/ThcOx family dehydrogenase [Phycisphaerales bacterium]
MKKTCAIIVLTVLIMFPIQGMAADANSAADSNSKSAEIKSIDLPKPVMTGGKPLMEALKDRKSSREFSSEKLPLQVLSNLLWAANGINREDGRRTAPTAMNKQEIDIYVVIEDGGFFYDPKANKLIEVAKGDLRGKTGMQPFVKEAPVNLLFVADYEKMESMPPESREFYSATDTGFVSQNVYLFCSSEGLATVVRGMVNRDECKAALKLREDQKVILAQTVGYPIK